jgi:diacylglycerol kinase family enzyme
MLGADVTRPETPAAGPADEPPPGAGDQPRRLTPHVPLKRAVLLLNPLSGSVGPTAAAEAEALLAEYGVEARIEPLETGRLIDQIDAALREKPDVLFVLAGDGTIQAVASRAGADGPLIAPLPGGTMNMLPKALYGTTDWKAALRTTLEEGEPQDVAGGEVGGHPFYCVAVLGSPALWAPAREAIRNRRPALAWQYARRALKRAFSGQVRFRLDGRQRERAEALVLISPMISKALDAPVGLEAAAMGLDSAAEAFRLAAHALFDDWRQDPAVKTRPIQSAEVWARSRIPAIIDGEPVLLPHETRVRFNARAFRALAPRPPAAEDSV